MTNKLTADEIWAAIKELEKHPTPTTPCPKCGKPCYTAFAHPSRYEYLDSIGYDGTCCFKWPEDAFREHE